jgi:hypothetical protein
MAEILLVGQYMFLKEIKELFSLGRVIKVSTSFATIVEII